MLIIRPVENKEEQKKICEACGVSYRADAMAYGAHEDDKLLGICQFSMDNDCGHLYDLCCADGVDDFEALFIMGRQTLNFIDLCGVHHAVFHGEETRAVKAVGFKREGGELVMDLEGFFTEPCKHEK